jgi:aryl-alcohol dehydrogenase-like predicted oxidoreductase
VNVERRKIGSLEVSVVGIGTNNIGTRLQPDAAGAVLDGALAAGVNFIDTSDTYGRTASEACIGQWLKGRSRDEVVLATKFGMAFDDVHTGGGSADYVRFSAEGSLSRLQTDYIDLYILHRPDPKTPIAETLGALGELVGAGKVREIGCSDFSAAQLAEADAAAARDGPRMVNLQSEYSLLNRKVELGALPECARLQIGFVPYRPLAHGLLTGKYRKDAALPEGSRIATMPEERRGRTLDERNLDVVEALIAFAADHGHTILELAASWLLARPEVSSVIGGAMSAEQIASNAEAASWRLTPDEVAEVGELTASYRENPV